MIQLCSPPSQNSLLHPNTGTCKMQLKAWVLTRVRSIDILLLDDCIEMGQR